MAPVASKPVAGDVVAAAPASSAVAPVPPANDNVAHAIAGAGGGILSTMLTYPLITLSTRAQVESRRADSSFLKAVEGIVAREGLAGLYAGLDSAVFGIGVTNFIYYYWYEWTRALLARRAATAGRVSGQLTTLESMMAGALAGSATVILTNPIWVVNTRITTRQRAADEEAATASKTEGASDAPAPRAPTTTLGTLRALLRDEGPRALFAGVAPALVLVINPILQYTLFEQLKNTVQKRRPITPGVAFVLGALSKLFATGFTYPYITVKSRMHVSKDREGGVTAALRRVVQAEGYAGLYKGIGPKITQSVLTAAFLFALKDVLYNQSVMLRARTRALRA